ncbi:class D sortase [Paenalkalicoccus suaedae]|uniref:Class D sortase n=1 Tax=Paenalkalicoccus suaedae TaxID=2592382 RepID=A0A859FCR9_9BACI|nr:class D sortase [Paenalkalicoccus suaedae]QKS70016.1 class D sortase [Paenalkalicoccus suaedae]
MRNVIATILMIGGLTFGGFNGYIWIKESSSGSEKIGQHDIVVQEESHMEQIDTHSFEEQALNDTSINMTQEELLLTSGAPKNELSPKESRDYSEYARGDDVGWLLIPALDLKYPIYWGTDDETLTQGVGYHIGDFTTPPDGLSHTVLSGHRDTVFRELGDLEETDTMYVQFEGVQYEYQINKTWITDADDRSVIVHKDEPTLTLTTCYPFSFIGPAPDRYIIEANFIGKVEM